MFRAAEAARKSCSVRIPHEESSVHTKPVEQQPLKVILPKPSLPFPGDFVLHTEPFSTGF